MSIIDGDTIRVRIQDRIEKVRYLGIDTPEVSHPTRGEEAGGREATVINSSLVERKTVRLEFDVRERDPHGRLLAYVYAGDLMVNAELIERGYAQVMTAPPNVRYEDLFLRLQRQARAQGRGLWAERPPQAGRPVGQRRPGVRPVNAWTCPDTHPIKGNFTTYSGERCIYHMPGGQFYRKTKPERCYVTEEVARQDGCRRSRR